MPARDLWFIGDAFVTDIYHIFSEMDNTAIAEKTTRPFAFEYFNVKCYTANPASKVKEVPARLVNCIIKAMNDRARLPRYIVIIADADIVKFINYFNFGFRRIAEEHLQWMAATIKKEVNSRKDALSEIRKGAVSYREPKLVWVEMIDRIHIKDKYLAMRNKFNGGMHKVLSEYRDNYIMNINREMFDASLFTLDGQLSKQGKNKFWSEVDKQLKMFEEGKISLKPICDQPKVETYRNTTNPRYKMPTPPQRRGINDFDRSDRPESFVTKRFHEFQGFSNKRRF